MSIVENFNMVPAPGNVVVLPEDGIKSDIIFLTNSQRGNAGTIVAVYEDTETEEGEPQSFFFNVGDRVIFGPHSGIDIRVGKTKYTVLKEREILMKVSDVDQQIAVGETEFDDVE